MRRGLPFLLLLATAAAPGCLGGQSGSGARARHGEDAGTPSCVCASAAVGTALHATLLERTGDHVRARVDAIVDPRGVPSALAVGDEVAGTWTLADRCDSIAITTGDEVLLFATPGTTGWLDSELALARWGDTTFTFGAIGGGEVIVPAADLAMVQDARTCRTRWP